MRNRAAAGAGHVHDQLPRRNLVQQRGQLGRGNIRAGQAELVVAIVEAAVADQHQHQLIVGFGLRRARAAWLRCWPWSRSAPEERVDLGAGLARQDLVQVLGPAGEALLDTPVRRRGRRRSGNRYRPARTPPARAANRRNQNDSHFFKSHPTCAAAVHSAARSPAATGRSPACPTDRGSREP